VTEAVVALDAILGGRLKLRQPAAGPRVGLDAVFLAGALGAVSGEVLDVGAGCGIVGLAVVSRFPQARVTGLEIDQGLAAMAAENAHTNGVTDRYRVVTADVLSPITHLRELGLEPESFGTVYCNPPYDVASQNRPKRDPVAARAHAMAADGLEQWARAWAAFARPSGRLAVVHRADRLADLLAALTGRFGAITVLPLHPHDGAPAHRILVGAIKGSRAPLTLLPGLTVHAAGGGWTERAAAVLDGQGAALLP
jgi:tRNA1(Val) A37 N6-methylase TrmN6